MLKFIFTQYVPTSEPMISRSHVHKMKPLPWSDKLSAAIYTEMNSSSFEEYLSSLCFLSTGRLQNFLYLQLRNYPLQKRTESSLQQQRPKQSPLRLCILVISSRNQGEKRVKNEMQSITTQHPQKKQKLLRAAASLIEPMKNEIPSVTEVIVMDGPACIKPCLNLSFTGR